MHSNQFNTTWPERFWSKVNKNGPIVRVSQEELAREFGTVQSVVSAIVRNILWQEGTAFDY